MSRKGREDESMDGSGGHFDQESPSQMEPHAFIPASLGSGLCYICGLLRERSIHDEPQSANNDYAEEDGEMRPIETDFYWDSMNKVWVYKWADTRLVLTADSVKDYLND